MSNPFRSQSFEEQGVVRRGDLPWIMVKPSGGDDTRQLRDAFAAGPPVLLGSGTFNVTPDITRPWEGLGDVVCAFEMRNDLYIAAERGASIRVANNVSTDGSPKMFAIFFTNQQLKNLSISGVTFDLNGENNAISPGRPSVYNRFNQAAIHVSGTPGGNAAKIDNVTIEHCRFKNTAGVSCIVAGQSNTIGSALGRNWRVRFCEFENNGLDTDDHSSIYLWAEDAIVHNCRFWNDSMHGAVGNSGGLVACELHGADSHFVDNEIGNYYQGVWVATNYTRPSERIRVQRNSMLVSGIGVDFYRNSSNEGALRNVDVRLNHISLTDDVVPIGIKAGIQCSPIYKASNVAIEYNTVMKFGSDTDSTGVQIASQSVAGQDHDSISVKGNRVNGTVLGVNVVATASCGLGRISVVENEFIDLTPGDVFSTPIGVSVLASSAISELVHERNRTVDDRAPAQTQYGSYMGGGIAVLRRSENVSRGVTVADHSEIALAVTRREGSQEKIAFTPAWTSSGTPITVGNGSATGSYAIDGDRVTVRAALSVGGTTSIAAGNIQLTLPVTSGVAGISYMGQYRLFDASASSFVFGACVVDGTSNTLTLQIAPGPFVTSTSPVPFATGDAIQVEISYQR